MFDTKISALPSTPNPVTVHLVICLDTGTKPSSIVLLMLINNLLQPVGKRLSRDIYDNLLTIGDYFHGLVNQLPETNAIRKLGLNLGINQVLKATEISLFHQREKAWSDVLTIPVAVYHTYLKGVELTSQILNEQLQIEQELAEFEFS